MATFTSFSPSSAIPGQKVSLIGTGFTGATAVKFGGVNALFFIVKSNTLIEAYPNFTGVNIITITTLTGDVSMSGFTLLLTKVKLTDLPLLGRNITETDKLYVWDILRAKLCQAPASALSAIVGTGGGGGGGTDTGNIFTALGSPFKIRVGDDIYSYDSTINAVTVTDVRLLGKLDYVVSATDVGNEFENYNEPASASGATSATDGTYVDQSAVNITGSGSGAKFTIKTVGGDAVLIIQTVNGSGYVIGDTFSIAALPGITFTLNSITGSLGNLIYDSVAGSVTILNYQLTLNSHITIYADGVVTLQLQTWLAQQKAELAKLTLAAAPFLPSFDIHGVLQNPGGLVAWFRPANEIPTGWAEWLPGRGNDLRGQDPSDVFDATTNPDGLSQANGTQGGSKQQTVISENNIPTIQLHLFSGAGPAGNLIGHPDGAAAWSSNHLNGNQDYDMKLASDTNVTQGVTSKFGQDSPDPINKKLDPFRIVNFIYSTQTP